MYVYHAYSKAFLQLSVAVKPFVVECILSVVHKTVSPLCNFYLKIVLCRCLAFFGIDIIHSQLISFSPIPSSNDI